MIRVWTYMPIVAGAVAGCGSQPASTDRQQVEAAASTAAVPARPFDPVKVELAKEQLLEEPKVTFLAYRENENVREWQVGVRGDGTDRTGYAGYICLRLREQGLVDELTQVWVLDDARMRAAGGVDVVQKSKVGGTRCWDERRLS